MTTRLVAAMLPVVVALACGAGGGTPEEAFETFNGHLAAGDLDAAAAMTRLETWEYTPGVTDDGKKEGALASVKYFYEQTDADFGRGEVRDRVERGGGVVELHVAYPRRGQAGALPMTYILLFKEEGGLWYYYVAVPPAPHA